jgi:SAM-dependent methyltransferase
VIGSGEADSTGRPALIVDADLGDPLLVHNRLKIGGSATVRDGISSVQVRIGASEFTASHDFPSSRFELTVDTSSWGTGEYPLEIVATDRQGRSQSVGGTVDVLPYGSPPLGQEAVLEALAEGHAAMWFEAPNLDGGVVAEESPEISGWATAANGIERVIVTIDDTLRLRAIHGLARPDLRNGFGDEVAADCGFALRLDPTELPPGQHVLTIVAQTRDGTNIGVAGTIDRVESTIDRSRAHDSADKLTAGPGTEEAENDLGSGERFVPELHRGTSLEPEHHARYRWAAPLVVGAKTLDAGCGVGWGTALLAEPAETAVGVDISLLAVSEARRRYGDVAEFREGDLHRLPFGDDEFDVIVCFEAIEHLAEPGRALDEMHRVLRPEGLLLISSPNRGVYPEGNPFHLHELTSEELEQSLASRFSNVAIYRQQTYVATLLGTDEQLELDDPSRGLDATVAKLVGAPPHSELYTVAAATDGGLPAPSSYLALGGEFDREEHLRMLEPWRDRAVRAETELARTRVEARAAARGNAKRTSWSDDQRG